MNGETVTLPKELHSKGKMAIFLVKFQTYIQFLLPFFATYIWEIFDIWDGRVSLIFRLIWHFCYLKSDILQ